jgi:indolepyruvate decarboxylase
LPKALGCADWFTARVTTLGELDEAMTSAPRQQIRGLYRNYRGKMVKPPALAYAHGPLKAIP